MSQWMETVIRVRQHRQYPRSLISTLISHMFVAPCPFFASQIGTYPEVTCFCYSSISHVPGADLALNKLTRLHPTTVLQANDAAVDGDGNNCNHFSQNAETFWMVDLGQMFPIESVLVRIDYGNGVYNICQRILKRGLTLDKISMLKIARKTQWLYTYICICIYIYIHYIIYL